MIPKRLAGHEQGGDTLVTNPSERVFERIPEAPITAPPRDVRLRHAVATHTDFMWRTARRFGVHERDIDDVLQRTWLVFASKLDEVRLGAERAYLVAVVARVASHARRSYGRRAEDLVHEVEPIDAGDVPSADEMADRSTARRFLDDILDAMDDEARQVFILFELEALDSTAIAELLQIPQGTVKSRLRRARELYEGRVARLRSQQGGRP